MGEAEGGGEEAGGDAEGADAGDGLTKLARQQSLLPKAEVDNALWNGAADEGWIVRDEVPVFKAPVLAAPTSAAEAAAMPEMVAKAEAEAKEAEAAMDKDPVRRYVGPSGTLYPTVERAVVAREAEATARLQRQVKTPAGQAALARSHPYALVGWRVSVYWKEEGGEGEAAAAGDALADYSGGWYTGQVTEYTPPPAAGATSTAAAANGADGEVAAAAAAAPTGKHTVVYDDGSFDQEVDLTVDQYKLIYKMRPDMLTLDKHPLRPNITDATFMSWPILSAAAASRLMEYIEPPPQRPSLTFTGGDGGGASSSTTAAAASSAMLPPPTPSKSALMNSAVGGGDLTGCGIMPELVRQASNELFSADPAKCLAAYVKLPPTLKLALLVAMADAACDTDMVGKVTDEVEKKRVAISEEHDRIDRETKKAARQEREELRVAVRQRLVLKQQAHPDPEIDGITESMVVAEMNRLTEAHSIMESSRLINLSVRQGAAPGSMAAGFGAGGASAAAALPLGPHPSKHFEGVVNVFSREELSAAEAEISMATELQANSGLGANGYELSKRDQMQSNARRDEMRHRRDVLPPLRMAAIKQLTAAIEADTIKDLTIALSAAKAAALEGDGSFDGLCGGKGRWVVTEVRDAYAALHELEKIGSERETAARRREALRRESVRARAHKQKQPPPSPSHSHSHPSHTPLPFPPPPLPPLGAHPTFRHR